jgi:NAD(P)-dependent dehydrogenase (short-subunit alcohol dehydrogenase family)
MTSAALVTGGGRGIGRAVAIELARRGWRVAVAARTSAEIAETVRIIEAGGGRGLAIVADVSCPAEVRELVRQAEALGSLDLLVNNAGMPGPIGPVWQIDPESWWRCVEVNLRAAMLCCHAVLPGMVARGRGRVINVASGAGTVAIPQMSGYVTGKAALIRFTETVDLELRAHGVRAFAIQPGTVRTRMVEEVLESRGDWLPWLPETIRAGRDVGPEIPAEVVALIASGAADDRSGRLLMAPDELAGLRARESGTLETPAHVTDIGPGADSS